MNSKSSSTMLSFSLLFLVLLEAAHVGIATADTTKTTWRTSSSSSFLRHPSTSSIDLISDHRQLQDDINITDITNITYPECSNALSVSDYNLDGIIDYKEYVGFVQLMLLEMDNSTVDVNNFFDLPATMQSTYHTLSCYFCNTNNTTEDDNVTTDTTTPAIVKQIDDAQTVPPTIPVPDDPCCIGILYTMEDMIMMDIIDRNNISLMEETFQYDEYIDMVCSMTELIIEETLLQENEDFIDNIPPTTETPVEGRIDICPPDFIPSDDCTDYESNLQCPYGHIYMGCTYEDLMCSWTVRCDCIDNVWTCLSLSIMPCGIEGEEIPEGLPWGQICDPNAVLPTPPPSV